MQSGLRPKPMQYIFFINNTGQLKIEDLDIFVLLKASFLLRLQRFSQRSSNNVLTTSFSQRLSYNVFLTKSFLQHLSHNVFPKTFFSKRFSSQVLSQRLSHNIFLTTSFLQRLSHNVFATTSFLKSFQQYFFHNVFLTVLPAYLVPVYLVNRLSRQFF